MGKGFADDGGLRAVTLFCLEFNKPLEIDLSLFRFS
jgi:hypothetical protein